MAAKGSFSAAPSRDGRAIFALLAVSPFAAVAAMFFAFGVGLGMWSGAAAVVLLRVGVGASGYGVALALFSIAYLSAMSSAGAVSRRFTVKRSLIAAALAPGPALAWLLFVEGPLALFTALPVYGFFAGAVDLTMNAAGARIERELGRPILARLHGCASAGIAVGAVLGGVLAASGAFWTASAIAILAMIWACVLVRRRSPPIRLRMSARWRSNGEACCHAPSS